MDAASTQEHGQVRVAESYERRLVPSLFEPWARRLVERVDLQPGERVLDVACGTGVLARAASLRVGPAGRVMGVDPNPGMLTLARRLAPGVEWREGQAQALPCEDQSFDAVLSQFGLMFVPAPESAMREMARVLRPGGRLAVAVFDGLDGNPIYRTLAEIVAREVAPEAGEALRSPFAMGDTQRLIGYASIAGLSGVTVTTLAQQVRFASTRDLVLGEVEGWFPFAGFHLEERTVEAVVAAAEAELAAHREPDGAIAFSVRAHVLDARGT